MFLYLPALQVSEPINLLDMRRKESKHSWRQMRDKHTTDTPIKEKKRRTSSRFF